ncbi:MAG: DNA-directed RNA polymerase subunit omega [Ignavibacteria bacterium]|nr:DNA-directed RNA polymerase subunit omega [Ignavibacteria bacterium]
MSVQTIDIKKLLENVENTYEAVVVAAKRARQINDELRMELNQRLEPIVTKETEDDTIMNQDKLNLSLDFEKREKPTTQALKEITDGKIEFRYKEDE